MLSANSAHSGRLIDCSGVFVMYEPLPLNALHDAHGLQTLDGLTHAGATDLEFGRKAQLRRQLVALLQLSAADLLEHVVHDLLVVDAGFWFHYDTSLSNIHKFCVDFLRIVFIYKEKKEWYD